MVYGIILTEKCLAIFCEEFHHIIQIFFFKLKKHIFFKTSNINKLNELIVKIMMSFYKNDYTAHGDILLLLTFYALLPPYQRILGLTFAELSCYNICAIVKTFSD